MARNLNNRQFAGAPDCPDCAAPGKESKGFLNQTIFQHAGVPQPDCRTYSWASDGSTVARDVNTHAERQAKADAIDARIAKLNPFRR